MSNETLFENMAKTIIDGDVEAAQTLAQQALSEGVDPLESLNQGFKVGLDEIGRGFEAGDYYLPDLVLAGKADEPHALG